MRVRVGGDGAAAGLLAPGGRAGLGPVPHELAQHYTIYAPEFPGTSAGDPYAIHQIDDLWDAVLVYEQTLRGLGLDRPAVRDRAVVRRHARRRARRQLPRPVLPARRCSTRSGSGATTPRWPTGSPAPPDQAAGHAVPDPGSDAAQADAGACRRTPKRGASAQAQLVWNLGAPAKLCWPIPDRGLHKRLHRIIAPTLIVWGEDDALISPVYAEEFAQPNRRTAGRDRPEMRAHPAGGADGHHLRPGQQVSPDVVNRIAVAGPVTSGSASGTLGSEFVVIHGTLDEASDPGGYARVRSRGPAVVAIGKFDGIHRGHQMLLSRAQAEARRRGGQAGVVTFDAHPREVLQRTQWRYLTTAEDRSRLIAEAGMDFVLLLRATSELFATEAEAFLAALVERLECCGIVVGANFRFGHGATGNTDTLTQVGAALGLEATVLDLLAGVGDAVSSTRIRGELESGRVEHAAELLGRPFPVVGVLHVEGLRRWVVKVLPGLVLPAAGVYSGRVGPADPGVTVEQPTMIFVPALRFPTDMRLLPLRGDVPASLDGRRVRLVFERAYTGTHLFGHC